MPLMSGGDAVVSSLLGHGISTIYCLPGVQSDHLFEAVICAFTGFLWARDGWSLPEDASTRDAAARLRDGWIWTPPVPAAASAAQKKSAAEG